MAFGSTPTDSNNIPIGCVYTPGVGFNALRGSLKNYTDASSNISNAVMAEAAGGTKPTYTYSISATAPYAAPTDWVVIRGSATKLVKIVRIEHIVNATAATAGFTYTIKYHTIANTSGTSTSPTPQQHDSSDAAATALVLLYSAAPTINAAAQIWKTVVQTAGLVTAAAGTWAQDRYVYQYDDEPYEPLTLRGVAQECAINFGGTALLTGQTNSYMITWTEE